MDNDVRPPKRPREPEQAPLQANSNTKQQEPAGAGSFRTPDEVAAEQTLENTPAAAEPTATEQGSPKATAGWRQKLALHWPPGKKEWLVAAGAVLLLGLAGVLILTHHSKKPVVVHQIKPIVKPVPSKTVASTLSGLQVDPSVNTRPVTAVMIENSTDARPQSGLGQAEVVFEAVAEGGITRFLALYQDTAPGAVGPVRSARPYYIQWELGFDGAYAHVGGSPEALTDIKTWNVRDLDQFANSGSYQRISSRAAPHNVYTSIAALNQLEAAKGYTSSTFTGFARKKEAPLKQPNAGHIDIAISGPLYNVHYDYVAATNSYNRSEGGAPHVDANNNATLSPKVVVVLVMPYGLEVDDHHSQYSTIGSGHAYIFQDGTVTGGQWAKASNTSQFVFTDSAGKKVLLNPGQTWLTALGDDSSLHYSL
jgi:hypothetical protein